MHKTVKDIALQVPDIPAEKLVQAIMDLSDGVKQMNASRLNRKAILVLLQASSGVSRANIEKVLAALEGMSVTYLKQRPPSEKG